MPKIISVSGNLSQIMKLCVNHGSVVVSKHGLFVGGPGSIPTAVTTMTAAGGDAEYVSLNH